MNLVRHFRRFLLLFSIIFSIIYTCTLIAGGFMEDNYLNYIAAADYVGLSIPRIYALAREGRLGRKWYGVWQFTREELDRYAALRTLEPRGRQPKVRRATS